MVCDYYLYVHLSFAVLSLILISQGFAFTHPSEVFALKDLYRTLNYPLVLQGWNGSDPCEESWAGVTCSGSSVIHLKIQGLNLTGYLGSKLYSLNNLTELDVSSNMIVGEMPFGLPPNAAHMNLSHNFLSGPIGDVFNGLDNLKELDLSYNNFSGDLPRSFGSLSNLSILFLQNNRFTGSVAYLGELPLTDLNIQDNVFSGILPHRFQFIPNLRIGGNKFHEVDNSPSWTFPLQIVPVEHNISHPPTTQASAIKNYPPPKVSEHKKKRMSPGRIAFMVGGGTLIATGVALLVAIHLNKLRAQNLNMKRLESSHSSMNSRPTSATIEVSPTVLDESPPVPPVNSATVSLLGPMQLASMHFNNTEEPLRRSFSKRGRSTGRMKVYTVVELQLATNRFNEGNLLGEGSLGPVYRAEFPDGKILAVKNINMECLSFREEEKFLDVICTASRLKHPNIVALNGYCLERGKHLLVYDYIRNLTLKDALHSGAYKPLSWVLRLRIALGVAQALDYLHSTLSPPVAHGNFKAANILLDENLMPHVCDCGLAILSPPRSKLLTIPATENTIGDRGYTEPEHGRPGTGSRKRDVFAFGVLLLELLTGRTPFDGSRPREEQYLAKWASSRLHDSASLEQMVDPSFKSAFSSKLLSPYANIIGRCIQPLRQVRPPMSEVVDFLASFSQKFNIANRGEANCTVVDPFERSFRSTNTRFIGSPVMSHVSN
ncbi:putative protein kinase RLK-Pelle-LRR-V family [Lupinus albus]|uniref:Protein kinase domain-containing protein n=1 Tax=Lupinus albus TaxID=3870 RepID=A0A6A4NWZ6_LUPAL|nr:putative protein kinase RLK-Pelle-LRR-V family [Lupinus albus]